MAEFLSVFMFSCFLHIYMYFIFIVTADVHQADDAQPGTSGTSKRVATDGTYKRVVLYVGVTFLI